MDWSWKRQQDASVGDGGSDGDTADKNIPDLTKSEPSSVVSPDGAQDTNNVPPTGMGSDDDDDDDDADADDDGGSQIIQFDNADIFGDSNDGLGDRVFVPAEDLEKAFSWTLVDPDVRVTRLSLSNFTRDADPDDFSEQRFYDFEARDDSFFTDVSTESATLAFSTLSRGPGEFPFGEVLALGVHWDKDDVEGSSWSGYFSLTEDPTAEGELQEKVAAFSAASTGTEFNPLETNSETDPNTSNPSVPGDDNSLDDDGSSSGGGGGGGLAKGAIAGIAVGGVVFLCLVGGLIWFLLRRRRNAKLHAGGYGGPGQDASNAYIVDKTDDGAAGSDPHSPHSPYSDDGQNLHTPLDPGAHHHPDAHHDQAASPWQEGQQQPQQQRALTGDEGAQQDGSARNYHHLVEEGMTEEDIRRLEEEERQLDAEIERAGRR